MGVFRGSCVVCGRSVCEEDFEGGRVVAGIGPEGSVFCCVDHLVFDAPGGPVYLAAVRAFAAAKAAQLRARYGEAGNGRVGL